jgi:hypothetical protein
MNYKKIYDNLISRAKNRQLNEYFEKHQIIPRCMSGDDSKDNLVELTGVIKLNAIIAKSGNKIICNT